MRRRLRIPTPNFRTALGLNPTDWYSRVAERVDTRVFVSSDKNLFKIIQNDPKLNLTALALFKKSPKQAWSSTYVKTSQTYGSSEAAFEGLIKFMNVWKSAYAEILHLFKPLGGKVFGPLRSLFTRTERDVPVYRRAP